MITVTVRPGPVLHIFKDHAEVVAVPLSAGMALRLASDILRAMTESRE